MNKTFWFMHSIPQSGTLKARHQADYFLEAANLIRLIRPDHIIDASVPQSGLDLPHATRHMLQTETLSSLRRE